MAHPSIPISRPTSTEIISATTKRATDKLYEYIIQYVQLSDKADASIYSICLQSSAVEYNLVGLSGR